MDALEEAFLGKKEVPQQLTPWQKGQSGNPNGRPKKLFCELVKNGGYSRSQIIDVYRQISSLNEEGLHTILDNEEAPMLEKLLAKAMLKDLAKGNLFATKEIMDRAIGKATEKIEVSAVVHTEHFITLPNGDKIAY